MNQDPPIFTYTVRVDINSLTPGLVAQMKFSRAEMEQRLAELNLLRSKLDADIEALQARIAIANAAIMFADKGKTSTEDTRDQFFEPGFDY